MVFIPSPPSRNDPCPCGSGKKYKNCCLAKDRRATAAGALRSGPAGAAAAHPWQMGIFPLPTGFDDQPGRRVSVVLVTAGGLVLRHDLVTDPLGRVDEVADALQGAAEHIQGVLGHAPHQVQVRHADVARALSRRLAPGGIEVTALARLRDLEEAAQDLAHHLLDLDVLPITASSPTWRGWGLSGAQCRALFAAAARFRRAEPWKRLDDDPITILGRHGAWTAAVMGCGGQEFGLSLYTDTRDFAELYGPGTPEKPHFEDMYGSMITLSFEPRGTLTREMQREVAAAGWEVADPAGYPLVFTVNTPAGGLDPAVVDVLAGALLAIPDFLDEYADAMDELGAGHRIRWTHEATGLGLSYDVPGGFVWPVPEHLRSGAPEGPGAGPGARVTAFPTEPPEDADEDAFDDLYEVPDAVEAPDAPTVDAFEDELRTSVTDATARKHARNAADLVEFLNGRQGVPLRAMHEFDLRVFLYEKFPRSRPGYVRTDALLGSLRKFLAFLDERDGLRFPWAGELLADRTSFSHRVSTAPPGAWWDLDVQEFRADVWDDLDRRVMLLRGDWTEELGGEAFQGPAEARLAYEAQRDWLVWRDALIGEGVDTAEPLRKALQERLRAWLARPDATAGGGPGDPSRLEVIRHERARMPDEERRAMEEAFLRGREDDGR